MKSASQNINNPLLDAFAFKSLDEDQIVVAFRGSNRVDEMQWEEDMKVNLEFFFTKQIKNLSMFSQIDQAYSFVLFILKIKGFPYCNGCNHLTPTEESYKKDLCDYSNFLYLTGHSKGGGIVQQVAYLLETLYKLKLTGVTFAATPIEGMSILVKTVKELGALYEDYDLQSTHCKNYLIKRDRVLLGLRLCRLKKFYSLFNNARKHNNINNMEKIPFYKLIKIPFIWKKEYIGQKYVISPQRPFYFVKPIIRIKKHSLSFFDRHFDVNGNIKATKRK
jgi:hypothetical protein